MFSCRLNELNSSKKDRNKQSVFYLILVGVCYIIHAPVSPHCLTSEVLSESIESL